MISQHLRHDMELQKALLLLMPVAAWVALFVGQKFSVRQHSGAFLAFVWQFQSSLILNILIVRFEFWDFETTAHHLYGVPIDALIGQAVLLGSLNSLILQKSSFVLKVMLAVIGLLLIYGYSDIIAPQPFWWLGIVLLTSVSVIPSLLIAEWTAKDRHVYLRSILQTFGWACLLLWLFPSTIFEHTNDDWQLLLTRPVWLNTLYVLPLVLPATLLLSAIWQFAVEGGGTAFPYDPPKILVTKGVYAYLSNPMQVGICLLVAWWGVMTGSVLVSLSALVAAFLFVVFKDICNGSCAIGDQDPNWDIYQKQVPKWLPRITPWTLN